MLLSIIVIALLAILVLYVVKWSKGGSLFVTPKEELEERRTVKKRYQSSGLFIVIIVSILFGWLSYKGLVANAYRNLVYTISTVPLQDAFSANDPLMKSRFLSQTVHQESIKTNDTLMWRILRNFEIIKLDETPDKVTPFLKKEGVLKAVEEYVLNDTISNKKRDRQYVADVNALKFLIDVCQAIGATENSVEAKNDVVHNYLANVLAQTPMSLEQYQKCIKDGSISKDYKGYHSKGAIYGFPRLLNPGKWGKIADVDDIIALLFQEYNVSKRFTHIANFDGELSLVNPSPEDYRQVNDFVLKTFVYINNHESVAKARNQVMIFDGPMQLAMFIVLWFCMINLFITFFPIKLLRPYHIDFMKAYDWGVDTLPVLGFIGTIIGLMGALGNAYKIPLASGDIEAAISISFITNTLSVAFTTTLMAFIFSIFLNGLLLLKKVHVKYHPIDAPSVATVVNEEV